MHCKTFGAPNITVLPLFSVYQRFKQTHFSIDFCQLSKFERKYLCDEALNNYNDRLEPNSADPSSFDRPCFRQAIMLKFREVNDLSTDKFSMWECPASENHPERVYFMGKSDFRDAVFLYEAPNYKTESDEQLTVAYPVMLIYNVSRNKLAVLRVSAGLDEVQRQLFRVTSEIITDLHPAVIHGR